ncbi:MAG: methyltransferase domain-containing protein [Ornithinimicrobium sp.]
MTEATTGQVDIGAAELYERFFVPALFGQWTARLLTLAEVGSGDKVLDVGCGTGVLARAARPVVGASGSVTGVDPNDGMLTVAERTDREVVWLKGVAEDLPIATGTMDRVLCQFALMFFTDPNRALTEIARVTRPGGFVVLATWADVSTSPGYAAMVELLRRVAGDQPANALLAPFSIGTESALHEVMAKTFPDVRVRQWDGTARFPSVLHWLETDIRAWTLRPLISDETFAELREEAPRELGRFCEPDGSVRFPAPALVADLRVPR